MRCSFAGHSKSTRKKPGDSSSWHINVLKALSSRQSKLALALIRLILPEMLPELAAEALHFLSRRDLDIACAVSKWLDALIAQCCAVYPLRSVYKVHLLQSRSSSQFLVYYEKDDALPQQSFGHMDEAVHFAGSVFRNSFVKYFQVTCSNQRLIHASRL